MSLSEADLEQLAAQFDRDYGTTTGGAGLYQTIGHAVAQSTKTLRLFDNVDARKRRPVTLMAAVHFLELQGYSKALTDIFSAPDMQTSHSRAGREFIEFCDEYSDEIVTIMQERSVQTNEVNRCVGLLPALMSIERQTRQSLALIEMGASAGLNLLFDRYHYDYAGGGQSGPPGSAVRLATRVQGKPPPLEAAMPLVEHRVGIDLEPLDYTDDDEVLWLRACIWAGEVAREQRLISAIDLARREWPEVRKGNVLTELPGLVDEADENLQLCLYNSWMMGWMVPRDRERLAEIITNIATRREIWWVTFEGPGHVPGLADPQDLPPDASVLGLRHLNRGVDEPRLLAQMQHHGTWIEWI